MSKDIYQEPLVSRYTSREMQELFSERTRIQTWRRCWIALAEAQNELGLNDIVPVEMINELKDHANDIDFELAARKEKEIRHDDKNIRVVQLLLGHTKIESTIRYLGIEVDDALEVSEHMDV